MALSFTSDPSFFTFQVRCSLGSSGRDLYCREKRSGCVRLELLRSEVGVFLKCFSEQIGSFYASCSLCVFFHAGLSQPASSDNNFLFSYQ